MKKNNSAKISPYDSHNPPLGRDGFKRHLFEELNKLSMREKQGLFMQSLFNQSKIDHDTIIVEKNQAIDKLEKLNITLKQELDKLRTKSLMEKFALNSALQEKSSLLYVAESARVKAVKKLTENTKYIEKLEFDLMCSDNIMLYEELVEELSYYKRIYNKSVPL